MAILRKQEKKERRRNTKKVRGDRKIRRGTKMIVGKKRDFSRTPAIFLDIDGVLNSMQHLNYYIRHHEFDPYRDSCCQISLSNLMWVMETVPDVHIVISSTWRGGTSISCLRDIFESWGMPKNYARRVVAKTPHLISKLRSRRICRGSEIEWFRKKFKVRNYVIIDDDGDMLSRQKKRFVQTDSYHGFMFRDAIKCVEILSGKKVNRRDI